MITINGGGGARIKSRQSGKVGPGNAVASGSIFIAPVVFAKSEIRYRAALSDSDVPRETASQAAVYEHREIDAATLMQVASSGASIEWTAGQMNGQNRPKSIIWEIVEYE